MNNPEATRNPDNHISWKRLQKRTARAFADWLDAGRRDSDMYQTQQGVTEFVISQLSDRIAIKSFVDSLPNVVGPLCNDPTAYLDRWNVLAYFHLYFLERYRRFYRVLERLYAIGHLPMSSTGSVRVLDIGAGPAPCLCAVHDFYKQVSAFAESERIEELHVAGPLVLHSVERSPTMEGLVHLFSELSHRPGPFYARFKSFDDLDLRARRQVSEHESKRSKEVDLDDDPHAEWPFEPEDFKYELYIFSNFLTTKEFVDARQAEIKRIFHWLGPGHQVLVMGSSGRKYDAIYKIVDRLASAEYVNRVDDLDSLFDWQYRDYSAGRVKAHYTEVLKHIHDVYPTCRFSEKIDRGVLDSRVPLKGPLKFRTLLYRRIGILPGRRWHRLPTIS